MPLDFPSSPTNGQVYGNYYYNSARGAWNALLPAATPNFFTNATLNTSTLVDATATASITSVTPLIVKSLSGQTTNIQSWQESSTILAGINQFGGFYTSNRLTVGASSISTSAIAHINTINAGNVGLLVKGAASQTANLQEWQNSVGTILSKIDPSGSIYSPTGSILGSAYNIMLASATTYTPLVVKGLASQTADLQQWQSSTGAVLSEINSAGELQVPRIGVGATMPTTTRLMSTASTATELPILARGAASQSANLQEWQNSSSTALSYISPTGHLVSPGINWIMFSTPVVSEFSFTSAINTSWTLNASVPTNAKYILANVFITASTSDHQNFVLSATQWTSVQNWVNTRGQQPSTLFGSVTQKDHVALTYFGESDSFSSNYGIWYNNLDIPTTGRTVWVNNNGNSGSNGWVYFVIRGYSL